MELIAVNIQIGSQIVIDPTNVTLHSATMGDYNNIRYIRKIADEPHSRNWYRLQDFVDRFEENLTEKCARQFRRNKKEDLVRAIREIRVDIMKEIMMIRGIIRVQSAFVTDREFGVETGDIHLNAFSRYVVESQLNDVYKILKKYNETTRVWKKFPRAEGISDSGSSDSDSDSGPSESDSDESEDSDDIEYDTEMNTKYTKDGSIEKQTLGKRTRDIIDLVNSDDELPELALVQTRSSKFKRLARNITK